MGAADGRAARVLQVRAGEEAVREGHMQGGGGHIAYSMKTGGQQWCGCS